MSNQGTRWQDLPLGGLILEAGNAVNYETGGWRAFRPVINWVKTPEQKACTKCLTCWLFCPESAMVVNHGPDGVLGEFKGVDLDHCKGCGICVKVCPPQCISWEEESKFRQAESQQTEVAK